MFEASAPKVNEVILIPITLNEFRELLCNVIRQEVQGVLKSSSIPIESKLLRLKEAADYLGLCKTTLYGHVHKGKLKPLKPGKHLFFTKESLDKYLNGEPPEPKADPSEYLTWRKRKSFK